jgi:endoglucanase
MDKYTDYLLQKNMTDAFFWSLGPNSGDVEGLLLDDWTTVDPVKVRLMQKLG